MSLWMGAGHCPAVQHRIRGARGLPSEAACVGSGGTDHGTWGETCRSSSLGLTCTHAGLPTCVTDRQVWMDTEGTQGWWIETGIFGGN